MFYMYLILISYLLSLSDILLLNVCLCDLFYYGNFQFYLSARNYLYGKRGCYTNMARFSFLEGKEIFFILLPLGAGGNTASFTETCLQGYRRRRCWDLFGQAKVSV